MCAFVIVRVCMSCTGKHKHVKSVTRTWLCLLLWFVRIKFNIQFELFVIQIRNCNKEKLKGIIGVARIS